MLWKISSMLPWEIVIPCRNVNWKLSDNSTNFEKSDNYLMWFMLPELKTSRGEPTGVFALTWPNSVCNTESYSSSILTWHGIYKNKNKEKTRNHSSRMHTAHFSSSRGVPNPPPDAYPPSPQMQTQPLPGHRPPGCRPPRQTPLGRPPNADPQGDLPPGRPL